MVPTSWTIPITTISLTRLFLALSTALKANATTVKNALEAYVTESGTAMPLTDTYGKTRAEDLELGLYLVVETKVPEMVTSTCNPFFICLPMTSSGGSWIYDVTVYPKNLTGNPTLDKTLRESKDDTGKHNGSGSITDGYADTGTASDGDSVDYQIISTLPSITSASTYLTSYTFADTLSKGITYNKHDVVLEFFTDAACTDPVARWAETDGKFTVTYSTTDTGESGMTIEMTADGLKEMNTAVYSDASMVNSGYSDCTLRITYAATVNSSADVVYGDNGNPNEVVLTWKRTSQNSYDTLKDDARAFTYGLELTKLFSDGKGDFSKVQFIMQNKTDGYYVKAKLDEATGVYYVTDHVADKKDATRFVPTVKDGKGKILISNQYVGDDKCIVESHNLIRRLTPLECERLQGFPDGWTNIPGASDSARYKALGNSVAIPCVEYVIRGIAIALRAGHRRRVWLIIVIQQIEIKSAGI